MVVNVSKCVRWSIHFYLHLAISLALYGVDTVITLARREIHLASLFNI